MKQRWGACITMYKGAGGHYTFELNAVHTVNVCVFFLFIPRSSHFGQPHCPGEVPPALHDCLVQLPKLEDTALTNCYYIYFYTYHMTTFHRTYH